MLLHGLSAKQPGCESILDHFKELKAGGKVTLKHWQVVGIIIDAPYEQRPFDDLFSIGPFDALDLTFFRPKFILLRIPTKMDITDNHNAVEFLKTCLKRHGYSVGGSVETYPDVILVWGTLSNSFM